MCPTNPLGGAQRGSCRGEGASGRIGGVGARQAKAARVASRPWPMSPRPRGEEDRGAGGERCVAMPSSPVGGSRVGHRPSARGRALCSPAFVRVSPAPGSRGTIARRRSGRRSAKARATLRRSGAHDDRQAELQGDDCLLQARGEGVHRPAAHGGAVAAEYAVALTRHPSRGCPCGLRASLPRAREARVLPRLCASRRLQLSLRAGPPPSQLGGVPRASTSPG